MKHKYLLLSLVGAALLCGCDKQTKLNMEKMVLIQQNQSKQLATIQAQLTAVAPMLDKVNGYYFEKSHDDAFFFHTNTLYLTLTVGRKIESRLQVAETDREAEHALAYSYHTNELRTMYLCTAQLEETLAAQESRMNDKVNAETKRLGDELLVKLSALDAAETVRQKEMAADVAQIKRDLEEIKLRLGITNLPAARP